MIQYKVCRADTGNNRIVFIGHNLNTILFKNILIVFHCISGYTGKELRHCLRSGYNNKNLRAENLKEVADSKGEYFTPFFQLSNDTGFSFKQFGFQIFHALYISPALKG